MRIEVMNQSTIESYAKQSHSDTSIVISITSERGRESVVPCNWENNIKDVIFLQFDDMDGKHPNRIKPYHANRIKVFMEYHLEFTKFDKVIVQCEAGQSRSAGVAAALMKFYNNDDTPIFNNPRYTPNMLCYRTVLEEMYR